MSRVAATNLGYPRIGRRRELKHALEGYWAGTADAAALAATIRGLRRSAWERQRQLGIDHVPSNDFSLYDHVLDTAVMVGAVPDRYRQPDGSVGLDGYFAMARGATRDGEPLAALELTKWFDTNYHYLVPELVPGRPFESDSTKAAGEFEEALALGIHTRPVLLGPVSFLVLSKAVAGPGVFSALLDDLVGAYEQVLADLAAVGADWVQIDEPCLAGDLDPEVADAFPAAYGRLAGAAAGLRLLVATYFGGLGPHLPLALSLPVSGVHLDLVADPSQLDAALAATPEGLVLSVGVVDGRNVWRADLDGVLDRLAAVGARLGADRLLVAPSCSLLHLPLDVAAEGGLDPALRRWLAFADQRLGEVTILARALSEGRQGVAAELAEAAAARAERDASPLVHDPAVRRRTDAIRPELTRRASPYPERRVKQAVRLGLPLLPTTTIGSFPQTGEVRRLRARHRRGELDDAAYEARLAELVVEVIRFQESVGLDVLVHGEFERNDMVEYFGERLTGCAVTAAGWVQSYGSRCVKPPIVFGDVSRPAPLTLRWWRYAQSLTDRPVKGMLTGPLTILCWSFVRDDQPTEETCRQIALAVRDEAADLEAAGAAVIQIDEPALREGLPLRLEDRDGYLRWAVDAFRLASAGVADETQVHTHMCYGDFDDIVAAIAAFDADVISIETSRSAMDLLSTFAKFDYPNDVGPGVWDIHSPRVPSTAEMAELIGQALGVFAPEQLWVNPDCGLKTRQWDEVKPALRNLVEAARLTREPFEADRP